MKKLLLMMIMTVAVLLASGCTNGANPEEGTTGQENEVVREKVIDITSAPSDVQFYEPMGRYKSNIINDENEDIISLYTSAQRDKKGEMMWDDSQDWVLQAETENGVYELYRERIHGSAYMNVSDYYNDGAEEKVITLLISSNAHNEIREYRFNGESFVETIAYTTDDVANEGISSLYTSIPDYE